MSTQKHQTKLDLKIYNELGSGSFGNVYRAFDPSIGRTVAVKLIELDTACEVDEILLELHILSDMRCAQITEYYGASLYDTTLFLTMELCDAGACMTLLRRYGRFKEDAAVYVLAETLKGLEYIHNQHKIHRDLKSANILVTSQGRVKIADFGVSAQLSQTIPQRHSFMGTPYWMAPEVIKMSRYDSSVDVWSLGIVAIELVCGDPPLRRVAPTDAMFMIVDGPPPHLPRNVKDLSLSSAYGKMVTSCLNKDPSNRPSVSTLLRLKLFRRHTHFSSHGSGHVNPPASFMMMVRRQMAKVIPNCRSRSKADIVEQLQQSDNNDSSGSTMDTMSSGTWDFPATESELPPVRKLRPYVKLEDHCDPRPSDQTPQKRLGPISEYQEDTQSIHEDQPHREAGICVDQEPLLRPSVSLEQLHPTKHSDVSLKPQSLPQVLPQVLKENVVPKQLRKPPPLHGDHPAMSDVFLNYINPSLNSIKARAKVTEAEYYIEKIREDMAEADRELPGFSRAFIEEMWVVISRLQSRRNNKHARVSSPKP